MDKLRIGMVGTSWYADLMHLPILKSHANAQITAICGRNRARADEMAAKYEIPHVFTDYREMLDKVKLDAVVIAVPDNMHYPISMAALDAGLHVLCEKPMASNLQQAKAMLVKAEAIQVKHMVYFTYRWMPQVRYMQQLLSEDFLGKPYHAHFQYIEGYGRKPQYQWKWDSAYGLGILGDLGSHMIDLARLALGEVARVQAHLVTHVHRPNPQGTTYDPACDAAMLTLQFKNGAHATIQVSAVAQVGEHRAILYGEKGALDLNYWFDSPFSVRVARNDEDAFQVLPIPAELVGGVDENQPWFPRAIQLFTQPSFGTRAFVDCIIEDKPATPNFFDGVKAQAVIDAAIAADRSGAWVDVESES